MSTTTSTATRTATGTATPSYVLHDGVAHMILASATPLGIDSTMVAHDGVEHEILATHTPMSAQADEMSELAAQQQQPAKRQRVH
jgi:hypothetical protein